LGNAELLVDVLMLLAMTSRHVEQQHFLPLLVRALALLPETDSVRARRHWQLWLSPRER